MSLRENWSAHRWLVVWASYMALVLTLLLIVVIRK